jgi:PilZ domain
LSADSGFIRREVRQHMTEVIRGIANRLGGFVTSIRSARRISLRVPVSVQLVGQSENCALSKLPPIEGYTNDLSESGLGIIVPSIRVGGYYLTGEGLTLNVTIDLPDGRVELKAVAQRYERLEDQKEARYLVGARIVELAGEQKARFEASLKRARDAASTSAVTRAVIA